MLFRSRIFYFFVSLIVILTAGFFVWNNFVSADRDVLAKFFSASISLPTQDILDIVPAINSEEALQNNPVSDLIQSPPTQEAESVQDQLDDIQEKLDVISVQVQELVALQTPDEQKDEPDDEDKKPEDEKDDLVDKDKDTQKQDQKITQTDVCTGQININTATEQDLERIIDVGPVTAQKIIQARNFYSLNDLLRVSGIGPVTLQKIVNQGCAYVQPGLVSPPAGGGGGGGSNPTVYPKILISEIQISPIAQRFVELYNPNLTDVDLTGWYLQRKTSDSWNSFVSSTHFQNKIITAGGYFLISRSDVAADILLSDMTLTPNNFLAFKSPDGEIVDQMGFTSVDTDKSLGRKVGEPDTDADLADFELDTPTPKAQNFPYIAPPPPADTTVPVITLIGTSEITINVGDVYVDAGATASDNIDGDITANITTVNPVDVSTIGDYTVTYNVSDVAGNHAVEVTRLVHVVALPPLSSDATVTSSVYTVSPITNGAGTITNVSFGTPKATFLNNLTFATGSLLNTTSSSLGDPIVSNDTLAVTAQDGITTAVYTITVNQPADITPPSVIIYTISNTTISPNGDGIEDSTIIDWKFSEEVKVNVDIVDSNGLAVFKDFYKSSKVTNPQPKTWDGKDSSGALVPDGVYTINIKLFDMAGNSTVDTSKTITVDSTL